ncbi:hypothetical protein [Streptomyces bacillaris]|uniref:hypothetical protein n=1 Tax=Streptomyces bacillaris TaxID=68179 RepID=UPI0034605CD1
MHTPRRTALAATGLGLALTLTGCSGGPEPTASEKADGRAYDVEYKVAGTGVRTLVYGTGQGTATAQETVDVPGLPWSKGLELKGVATSPTVSMILGEEGGRAECVILVNGREAHRATADGAFGTATCTAPSPTRDAV